MTRCLRTFSTKPNAPMTPKSSPPTKTSPQGYLTDEQLKVLNEELKLARALAQSQKLEWDKAEQNVILAKSQLTKAKSTLHATTTKSDVARAEQNLQQAKQASQAAEKNKEEADNKVQQIEKEINTRSPPGSGQVIAETAGEMVLQGALFDAISALLKAKAWVLGLFH